MNHMWYNYEGCIPLSIVDAIREVCLRKPLKASEIDIQSSNKVNKNIRSSQTAFLAQHEHSKIYELFTDFAHKSNNAAFGFDISNIETLQFTVYNEKDKDYYDWHEDTHWMTKEMCHRKLTMVLQLSDPSEYEGGQLELKESKKDKNSVPISEQDRKDIMKKGSIIVFPSFFTHRVAPVTKGTRLSLVAWVSGPLFR